jgi:hypothetical protein
MLLAALPLAWCAVPGTGALAAAPAEAGVAGLSAAVGQPDYAAMYSVLDLANQERAKEDLPALVMDAKLISTAMLRAREAAERFEHLRPDGSSCFTAFPQDYIKPWGENLAYGQPTAAAVMAGWMASTSHRANIMGSDYRSIGVGVVVIAGRRYWAQSFTGQQTEALTLPQAQTQPLPPVAPMDVAATAQPVSKTLKGPAAKRLATVTATLAKKRFTHKSGPVKPRVSVAVGKKRLVKGRDYSLSYRTNAKPGAASVVVRGKGKWKGISATLRYTITPSKPTLTSVTAETGLRVRLAWTKASAAVGYQVQASDTKAFGKGNSITLPDAITASILGGSFAAGKRYHLRVRGYMMHNGKRLYGPWSKSATFTAAE